CAREDGSRAYGTNRFAVW
nr:immunoglobulin heavy chain junction region [Macaca mulatta]MOW19003.1 immunoglobulin heavy chain junction region [Macaca mulatta]MOW19195.1 immunoglobulin heavy chain junction region [Macaca mulatta]MOW19374.1 immunoglobulin heavy chain junction region [Macaca mulatta]MOW19387.1 immunoglobulin heavy chain junction region [Macaca mulatta]